MTYGLEDRCSIQLSYCDIFLIDIAVRNLHNMLYYKQLKALLSIEIRRIEVKKMKLNQFGRLTMPIPAQITELKRIQLLPADFADDSLSALATTIFSRFFPEAHSKTSQHEALGQIQATAKLDLAAYLSSITTTIDQRTFYNVALQLLGFEVEQDFKLNHPRRFMASVKIPYIDQPTFNRDQFLEAIYLLLNTRSQTGLLLIDQLANRGFFTDWQTTNQPNFLIFNGKTQPVFDTQAFIKEIVYVESSLDTDLDGHRDLLETTIFRPIETNHGLKVPALYTASPYYKGINNVDHDLHNVDGPIDAKETSQPTLAALKATATRSDLPAARQVNGQTETAEVTATSDSSYSLNDYFLARGFATIYAGGIGTRGSDGVRTCGSPAETESTTAIIEWLAGNRRAFTNRTDQIEIKAWWCNHNVAMTGKSYLGTLATAAATTGVAGLKTIISEAAISSWYDYYRENGLVVAPVDCQGEDADVLAKLCQTRQKDAADYAKSGAFFQQQMADLQLGQDRITGNYNAFWAERNYRDNIENVTCDVVIVHGLNDWNVKPQNAGALWDALRTRPVEKKVFLHQGPHVYMNNIQSIDFTDMMNLWLTNHLLDVDNQTAAILPNVVIQDNAQESTWQTQEDWLNPDNSQTTYYLNSPETLSLTQPAKAPVATFIDDGVATFKTSHLSEHAWQDQLLQPQSAFANNRLLLQSPALTQAYRLDGRVQFNTKVAVNANHGLLSVMLVDLGVFSRLNPQPTVISAQGQQLGYRWQFDDLKEFKLGALSDYQVITKGHINLQNRQNSYQTETVTPGEFYPITLDLQPTHYHLLPGHQLGLVVYATDMGMTLREEQATQYRIDLSASRLTIPNLN